MIAINYPIFCPKCGLPMENFTIERFDQRVLFSCSCGNIQPITFEKYKSLLKDGKVAK